MLYPTNWQDYELIDIGNGRKLERFGELITDRPEPAANFKPGLSPTEWKKTDYFFSEKKGQKGSWNNDFDDFMISYPFGAMDIRFHLRQTRFKHLGIFPEQAENWGFIADRCQTMLEKGVVPKVLNLFAYTGGASLAANLSGADATHVDSVKSVVTWARENADLNKIETIRWIVEDARKFVEKSVRRGDQYHGIIMDPPIHGLGPKGKHWKLNRDLPDLLENVIKILHPEHRFFILNTYSPQLPLEELKNMLKFTPGFPKSFEATTLGLKANSGLELELGNLVRF
jgi:23S rRNA (cytosine1962-C5)-methyltransferase